MFLSNNITWHGTTVSRDERCSLSRHRSGVVWLTGLPASGKSTIANQLEYELFRGGVRSYILDGDNVRHGLNRNLTFSAEDRREGLRRVGEVAKLFVDAGYIAIVAFVSPCSRDRQMVREMFGQNEFLEVFVKCSLEVCELRDPKGLYKKARIGEILNFTGVNDPYEAPENADITLETDKTSMDDCVKRIFQTLVEQRIIALSDETFRQQMPMPAAPPDPLLDAT